MKKTVYPAIVLTVIAALIFLCGYRAGVETRQRFTERDTATFVDTIRYCQPIPRDCTVVRYVTKVLPVTRRDTAATDTLLRGDYAQDMPDSAAVVIPITQKRYEGEDYRAYVSGYEPRLDSIFVYSRTTTVRERSTKPPKKWCIGIQGGMGYGIKSKQVEPFVGIGISYNFIRF